ncbi:MAG: PTS sugar transporter subunit IIA [bacterium]
MRLCDHLDPALTFVGLEPADKSSLLREIVDRTTRHLTGIDPAGLLRRIEDRERKSSTGVGSGIAIPHCVVTGLDETVCVLVQIPIGVEYDAVDGAPVYFVFMLLSPTDAMGIHLRMLARVSRVANREGFTQDVIALQTAKEVYDMVISEDESHVD